MSKRFARPLRRALAMAAACMALAFFALGCFAAYPMPIQTANEDQSVYLFDLDTGKVILEQNADTQRYIASLTKLMTALLLVESDTDLEQAITVPSTLTQEFKDIQMENGTGIDLRTGENVRRIDLLYSLLVASANDAASVIADDLSGHDIPAFVARMNQRAKELGCTATSYTCVHGLYDHGNVSTARDIGIIAQACYQNQQIMDIVATVEYTLPATNFHTQERTIRTTNLMQVPDYEYYRAYIRGLKTGFTTPAGRCFVTFAEQDGHTYCLVVLGSDLENIYRECAELLDWVFATFADRQVVDTTTEIARIPLRNCRTASEIPLYAAASLTGYGHPDDEVTFALQLPESVKATVEPGQVVGSADVLLAGYKVGTVDLVAHDTYHSDLYTDGRATLLLLPALLAVLLALAFATVVLSSGFGAVRRRRRRRR